MITFFMYHLALWPLPQVTVFLTSRVRPSPLQYLTTHLPIKADILHAYLKSHPDHALSTWLISSLQHGFTIISVTLDPESHSTLPTSLLPTLTPMWSSNPLYVKLKLAALPAPSRPRHFLTFGAPAWT